MTTVSAVVFLYSPEHHARLGGDREPGRGGRHRRGRGDGDAGRRHLGGRLPGLLFPAGAGSIAAPRPGTDDPGDHDPRKRPDPPHPRPPHHVARDQAGDAARLGLVGRRPSTPSPPRICTDLVEVVQRRRHPRLRAAAGQRHVLGGGRARQPGAARRQGAGAAERRLLPAHPEDPQVPRAARTWRSTSPRTSSRPPRWSRRRFARDPAITHVAQVHCETGTGILNPLAEIAAACARHGKGLIVDAMSSLRRDRHRRRRSTRSMPWSRPRASASRARPAWAS